MKSLNFVHWDLVLCICQRPDQYIYQVSVYLQSISILIIILIFKYWYWYFLFRKRTEILILQYFFCHQYQYFSKFLNDLVQLVTMFGCVWLALATWRVKHWACCDTNKTINITMCTASSSCAYLTPLTHAYSLFGFGSNIMKHKYTPLTNLICSTQWAKLSSKGTPKFFFSSWIK